MADRDAPSSRAERMHQDALERAAVAASERRQQLAASYAGEWVAVSQDWQQVYAHGASYLAVCAGATAKGARNPLIARLT